jgi:site-specific recombinase XerC
VDSLTVLNDPLILIERADLSETTKRQYRQAVRNYLAAGHSLTDSEALSEYAKGLKKSSKAFLKAAIKLWSKEIETITKGQATPDNVAAVQASIYRLEALNEAIKVKAEKGNKAHIWLKPVEVKRLLAAPGDDIAGQRDRLVLALLVGAGLRRDELAGLEFKHIEQLGDRTVLNIKGKGDTVRVVPINSKIAQMIDDWSKVIGTEGYIIRALGMNREPTDSISGQAIFDIVFKYGKMIGKPNLQPHDLRRSYAQFGVDNGIPIQQISVLLGHSSVVTTQRYLNLDVDLSATISDFVPI